MSADVAQINTPGRTTDMADNSPHRPLDEPPTDPRLQIGQRWSDRSDPDRVVEITGLGAKRDAGGEWHSAATVVVVQPGWGLSLGRKTSIRTDNILRRFRHVADEQKDNA